MISGFLIDILMIYALFQATAAGEDFISISNQIPVGFEDLAGPQTNQIDVFFQGRFVVATEATYTFETITFSEPGNIVNNIDQLIDPNIILEFISQPLATNTDQLCLDLSTSNDCGVLEPNVAGVIFDEGRFRVDLFINALQLKTQFVEVTRYLPEADDKFSAIHSFNLNLSGTDEAEDTYNLQSDSIVAFGDTRLVTQTNFTSTEGYIVDEISLQKDFRDVEAEIGIFETETRSANFFVQTDVTGIRVQSSLNTRTDIDSVHSTEIFIFLNVRSRVEVFRNSRLIDARFYDAGNQQLDTSRFPDGAYQISVRIREEGGSERTEQYFFVRNGLLPPVDDPIYYAEVGTINDLRQDSTLPNTTDSMLAHTGVSFRASENIALEGELVYANKQTMVQTGIVHVGSGMQSQLNVMTTSENDWGVSVRESIATEKFTLNLDYRHISEGSQDNEDNAIEVEPQEDFFESGFGESFDFVRNDSTQATASLTHTLFDGRAIWRYRHLDNSNRQKSETISFGYRRQMVRKNNYQVDWELDGNKDSDDYLIGARIQFTLRKANDVFRVSSGAQTASFNNDREQDYVNNAQWQHTRVDPSYGRVQSELFHINERDFTSSGFNIESQSRYGFNEIGVNQTTNSGQDALSYALQSQFNIASDFKTVSFGGADRNGRGSAIVVNLEGHPKGEEFEVYVNRQSVGFATVGKKSIFSLPPYNTYDVRLASRADAFLSFDENPREVTLYPGNVSTLHWNVDRELIFIGRVVDEHGVAIKNARIENGDSFAGTDERGWFQIETGNTEELSLQKRDGTRCQIKLGQIDTREDIHVFEDLQCETQKPKSHSINL
jgi:hypothetical protein